MRTLVRPLLLGILACAGPSLSAQNVAINANGAAPAASALLDLDGSALPAANQKGVLLPRVALTATNVAAPVVAPAISLLLYNTATAGAVPNNVTPGYYYWNGVAWVRLLGANNAWLLTGNALTGTEFMGSTNSQAVRFFANNIERMRINPVDGEVIVGAATSGLPGDALCAVGSAVLPWAVNGYSSFNGGAVYGQMLAVSPGAWGAVQGEYFGTAAGQGVRGIFGGTNTANTRAGVYGTVTTPTTAVGGAGVWGFNGIGTIATNQHMGVLGSYNTASYGIGVHGVGFGGGLIAGNNDVGVVGWVGNGFNFSGYFNGNHVVANGTKTASVGTSQGNQLLYVTETPEVWFEDIGRAQLVDGQVTVTLDPLFLETVFIDSDHPMHVFVQVEGNCNGVFVEPGTTGFTVRELAGGTSEVAFSYRVMAKRLHFQDHRFGNDPVWGGGDTRVYSEYVPPPPVDHAACVSFWAERRKNWKPTLMPEGFVPVSELQRNALDASRTR